MGLWSSFEELNSAYGNREDLEMPASLEYVLDCYDLYEEAGFADTFETSFDDYSRYNGKHFEVIRRIDNIDDDCDLDILPQWKIKFEDGIEINAYPEEICLVERKGEGNYETRKRIKIL